MREMERGHPLLIDSYREKNQISNQKGRDFHKVSITGVLIFQSRRFEK